MILKQNQLKNIYEIRPTAEAAMIEPMILIILFSEKTVVSNPPKRRTA